METLRELVEMLDGDWVERTDLHGAIGAEVFDKCDGRRYLMRIMYNSARTLPVGHSYVLLFSGHDGKETFTDPVWFDTLEALLLYAMANGYAKHGVDAPPPLEEG